MHQLTILVTRPIHQTEPLCYKIKAFGGNPITMPTIEILPTKHRAHLTQSISQLAEYDIAIFTSVNAVSHTLSMIQKDIPTELAIGAIGEGTKNALENAAINVDFYPKTQFNSEGLLALQELAQIQHKKIIIFAGEGGRNLLMDTLIQRGAFVTKAEVYRRVKPEIDCSGIISQLENREIDITICTSNEGLNNLVSMLGEKGHDILTQMQLLGVSLRMVPLAETLGFVKKPIIANNASDDALINTLIDYKNV